MASSWSGLQYQRELAGLFEAANTDISVDVQGVTNHSGVQKFFAGKADVLVYSGALTRGDRAELATKFGEDYLKSKNVMCIGRFAVIVVSHKGNAISHLSARQIQNFLHKEKAPWSIVGGDGRASTIYATPDDSKGEEIIQNACMGIMLFRKDMQRHRTPKEITSLVSKDRTSLGYFLSRREAIDDPVTTLAIGLDDKGPYYLPTDKNICLGLYPLTEELTLYVHPDAPSEARRYCEYAMSAEGAKVAEKWYLYPHCDTLSLMAAERLADSKAGKGTRLSTIGVDNARSPFQDLATEYVRAKAVVQLSYVATDADVSSVGAFITGDTGARELLLLGDKPSGRAMELYGEKWLALGVDEKGQPTGGGPEEHMIAGRAVAVIVNPANKIESLTLGQVQAIFQGDVDDWAIIGGTELTPPAGPGGRPGKLQINLFGLFPRDPASAIFEKEGVPRDKWKRVTLKKDTAEALAAVSMDPQAIAFVDLSAIPATGQSVKILPIKFGQGEKARNIAPTAENIKNAMYPLSQRYFLYVHPKASDTAKDFASFIATCGGSEASPYADTVKAMMDTYRKHGLIPLADEAITRAAKDAMAEAAARARAEEAAKSKRK